jgi:MFS family permease
VPGKLAGTASRSGIVTGWTRVDRIVGVHAAAQIPFDASERRTLAVLAAATAVGSLGLAAGGTAGALLAEDITGSEAAAGVPLGVLVAGSAAGALLIARQTSRSGRAAGLILGYVLGAAGAVTVIGGAIASNFAVVLLGSAGLGAANAAVFLTRYAAADVGSNTTRGRALGTVFVAAAAGAIASPNLLGPSGRLADTIGLPDLAGLYLVAIPAFAIAATLLGTFSRAPSRLVEDDDGPGASRAIVNLPGARGALIVLGAVNFVMVAVMAIAPVHLTDRGHELGFVGLVVGIHVFGMFAPSPLSGWLADRAGSATVVSVGALLLVAAGVSGAVVDSSGHVGVTIVLALLGLGWNAGVVGGSTMLASSVPAAQRPRAEGFGEIAMGGAAAIGAVFAGLVVAFGGFPALALAGATAGALLFVALRLGLGGGELRGRPRTEAPSLS